jgi:hypothetical protein
MHFYRRQICKIWKGEIAEFLGVGFAKFEVAGSSYHFLGKGREMLRLFGGRFELAARSDVVERHSRRNPGVASRSCCELPPRAC